MKLNVRGKLDAILLYWVVWKSFQPCVDIDLHKLLIYREKYKNIKTFCLVSFCSLLLEEFQRNSLLEIQKNSIKKKLEIFMYTWIWFKSQKYRYEWKLISRAFFRLEFEFCRSYKYFLIIIHSMFHCVHVNNHLFDNIL